MLNDEKLPVGISSMGYLFSAIIWRLDSYLIAMEAFDLFGLEVKPELALEAITKDSDNTEEHRNEQIHLQRGMGKNYERLEFIGDCFLKLGTSITLYSTSPDDNEFEYHVRRMLMICNSNLLKTALNANLQEFIRTAAFSRSVSHFPCPGEAGSCFGGLPKPRLVAPETRTLLGHGIRR